MECNEVRAVVDAYVDCELSSTEARSVEAHLRRCAECRRESEAVLALSHAVRQADYHRAPDELRARILAALPQAAAPDPDVVRERTRRRRMSFAWWKNDWRLPRLTLGARPSSGTAVPAARLAATTAAGLAFCAAAAAVVVTLLLQRPAGLETVADELVASHVRAQLSGHDIDVVSTDQHTVKPWFNGRLDYAPPVEDLASSGFALVGGRLDYIGHRRVAVLVYRYRKHVVDVYVFPEADVQAAAGTPPRVRDGYAVARWHQRDMVWWAVTDAAPAVLDQFEAALDTRLRTGG
jgi:anti-sigma factor RsiW